MTSHGQTDAHFLYSTYPFKQGYIYIILTMNLEWYIAYNMIASVIIQVSIG